jgi:hypothetical protein
VGRKNAEDARVEERIRAHVRRQMRRMNIGVAAAAAMCHCDQGNLSRVLMRQRGLGLGLASRLVAGLSIDALQALTVDIDPAFYAPGVPRPTNE